MNIKHLLLVAIGFLLYSCHQISPSYLDDFYQQRQNHLIGLIAHERAPLTAKDAKKVSHFAYDPSYRVKASYTPTKGAKPFDMATYSGQVQEYIERGTLIFSINGAKNVLHVYQSLRYMNHPIYGKQYFIPFKDVTNGSETYGGGRYIDIDKSQFESGKLMLDFNAAYNPWCAYADGYNCPVPPNENHLDVSIKAGEMSFEKTTK